MHVFRFQAVAVSLIRSQKLSFARVLILLEGAGGGIMSTTRGPN